MSDAAKTSTLTLRLVPGIRSRLHEVAQRQRIPPAVVVHRALFEFLERRASGVERLVARDDRYPDRLSVNLHLRPGDREALRFRAVSRGVRVSTYLTLLARAHLRADPPLPKRELMELKRAVAELGALRRAAAQSRQFPPATMDAVAHAEDAARSYVRAALRAWECPDA